jgi:hypothetical protein
MKAKDNIEEIILNNLEGLNDNEPMDGHFERFEAKLNTQNKKKVISLNLVLKVAAAIVFVFLATNQAIIYFSAGETDILSSKLKSHKVTLASVSPEYEEVEFYYTNAINVGLNQWNELKSEGLVSVDEQQMMNNELKEFEELQKSLQVDLATSPQDERVINAMLEYYQSKLNVINMIVDKLQEVKELKENNDQSVNI